MLYFLIIFFSWNSRQISASLNCCPGNNTLGKGLCSDGSKAIQLDCDARYILNPNLDDYEDFYVDEQDRLVYKDSMTVEAKK